MADRFPEQAESDLKNLVDQKNGDRMTKQWFFDKTKFFVFHTPTDLAPQFLETLLPAHGNQALKCHWNEIFVSSFIRPIYGFKRA